MAESVLRSKSRMKWISLITQCTKDMSDDLFLNHSHETPTAIDAELAEQEWNNRRKLEDMLDSLCEDNLVKKNLLEFECKKIHKENHIATPLSNFFFCS